MSREENALLRFLFDVSQDPRKLAALKDDPAAMMRKYRLPERERDAVMEALAGDPEPLKGMIPDDDGDFGNIQVNILLLQTDE